MNLDERIDTALHPERNGVKMRGIAEGASHEHVIKDDIKQLIRDVVEYVKPERMESTGHLYQLVHGYNTALDEMEAKAKELGL